MVYSFTKIILSDLFLTMNTFFTQLQMVKVSFQYLNLHDISSLGQLLKLRNSYFNALKNIYRGPSREHLCQVITTGAVVLEEIMFDKRDMSSSYNDKVLVLSFQIPACITKLWIRHGLYLHWSTHVSKKKHYFQ